MRLKCLSSTGIFCFSGSINFSTLRVVVSSTMVTRYFPGGNAAGAWRRPPFQTSAKIFIYFFYLGYLQSASRKLQVNCLNVEMLSSDSSPNISNACYEVMLFSLTHLLATVGAAVS